MCPYKLMNEMDVSLHVKNPPLREAYYCAIISYNTKMRNPHGVTPCLNA